MKLTSVNRRSFRRPPIAGLMESAVDTQLAVQHPLTGSFLAGRIRSELDVEDLDLLEAMAGESAALSDRDVLTRRGEVLHSASLLREGLMFRTIQRNGRRFIVGLCVPGDFVDLHGFALRRLDHNIVAVGKVDLVRFDHARIKAVFDERPSLARAMWFASLLDAAVHRRWIQMFEQHDAPRRIAHIYCELHTRLGFTGRAEEGVVRAPFTQFDLADMCGVSAVHANRAVAKLREIELAEIRRGTLYATDWEGLKRYAGFDPQYLFGASPP